jgi:hypothetical protein
MIRLIAITLCLALASAAYAAEDAAPAAPAAPAPAAPAAEAKPADAAKPAGDALAAVVQVVEGTVETRTAVGQPWTPVKTGMKLAEGADIRTGFRARCILDMTDSLVQVDPLTVVRIAELKAQGNKVKTRLHMKQGNTQAVVEKPRMESDFAVVTPSATLSVRGTQGIQCGFFPAFGGTYGLSGPGLIALRSALLARLTLVRQGEYTNDWADPAFQQLLAQYIPIILNRQGGYTQDELLAALRWNAGTPTPGGLGGPMGPTGSGFQGRLQQINPSPVSPCDGGEIIDPYTPPGGEFVDITLPPH